VNWSDGETADVPPGVVTFTSTCPAAWAGATATIMPEPLIANEAAATPPKLTNVAPEKLLPKIVTEVPPAVEPVLMLRLLTTGAADWNVNWSALEVGDVRAELTTLTSTTPADSAGETAVIDVLELTANDEAAWPPNITPLTFVKFVPMITTCVPPAVVPSVVPRPVTAGGLTGAVYTNWSLEEVAELPPLVATITSTVPAVWAGATAVMELGELIVTELAFVPPNVTPMTLLNPVPVIVMLVPPEPDAVPGETPLTVGPDELYVYLSPEFMADVPAEVTTVTSSIPPACAGAMTEMDESDITLNEPATVFPNMTAEALLNPLPEIETELPPAAVPELGPTPVTVGGLAL
jgi:hypothetical protein